MKLFEHQAKALLAAAGIPTPRSLLAKTPEEAEAAAQKLGGACVVKAQLLAGGRGKAGGVRLCASPSEAKRAAAALLGKPLVTAQTGEQGEVVRSVLVEERLPIEREAYFAIALDRSRKQVLMLASTEGGVEIEEMARKHPERIRRATVAPDKSFEKIEDFFSFIENNPKNISKIAEYAAKMIEFFWENDCILLEVNPFVKISNGSWVVADAKLIVDDNALFRQPQLARFAEENLWDAKEARAKRFGLSYIHLQGEIGCVVNGAGLAMATMDLIRLHGGRPANFLDVGGGASPEAMREGFALLFEDPQVKAVLVNIFGGIVRCDLVAEALVAAVRASKRDLPTVLRLVGTNEEQGRRIVEAAGLAVRWEQELDRAARAAVELAR